MVAVSSDDQHESRVISWIRTISDVIYQLHMDNGLMLSF
jgi:hypothetical protein